jgi:hypothetical protein
MSTWWRGIQGSTVLDKVTNDGLDKLANARNYPLANEQEMQTAL